MGLDLTAVIDRYGTVPGMQALPLGYDRVSFQRHQEFFTLIQSKLETHPLPPGAELWWYGDDGLEKRTTDPYGVPLTWCWSSEFQKLDGVTLLELQRGLTPFNGALLLFLKHLPPEVRIFLWWH
jgi:hypothetical protein